MKKGLFLKHDMYNYKNEVLCPCFFFCIYPRLFKCQYLRLINKAPIFFSKKTTKVLKKQVKTHQKIKPCEII